MLQELRKLLAECHPKSGDKLLQVLKDTNPGYLIRRIEEEILSLKIADPGVDAFYDESENRLKAVIFLANLARFKLRCSPGNLKQLPEKASNRKSKAGLSNGSEATSGSSRE